MCLSVPSYVVERDGSDGVVEVGGNRVKVGFDLLPDAKVGDYVLIHAGFALEKFDLEEAHEMLDLLGLPRPTEG